ncbi:MAG: transcription antitermination factor NusB [Pseudomonadota bacterium]
MDLLSEMETRPSGRSAQSRRKRSAARFYAVQALFQMEASGEALSHVEHEFEAFRIGAEADGFSWVDADLNHFRALLRASVTHQAQIDQVADRALNANWPLGRVDPTLRAVLRAAGAELLDRDTPVKVTVTEFVEVTKAFFPDSKEPKLVNAVLDYMARDLKPGAFTA